MTQIILHQIIRQLKKYGKMLGESNLIIGKKLFDDGCRDITRKRVTDIKCYIKGKQGSKQKDTTEYRK